MIDEDVQLVFEYPIKEQVRSFLRLEALFLQFNRNRLAIHSDNHLHALKLFFEILEILERGDTRAELIKELARLSSLFTQLKQNPGVDLSKLDNFLKQIKQLYQWVLNYEGKFGERLRKDHFVESVKHRTSIPGGTCPFDSPDLYLFLNKPHSQRQKALTTWLDDIKGVKTSIEVILRIMRESGQWKKEVAPLGSFIIESADQPLQLLRVKVSKASELFPEFSCGKHRSIIHFMQFNSVNKKIVQQKEVQFELACCS